MTPLTVLIPARNAAATLGITLQTLGGQLRPEDEVLVIDDGSTDGCGDLARAHGARVETLPTWSGVAVARNVGIRLATHDIILFTDADATLSEGAVQRVRERMSAPDAPGALVGVYSPRVGHAGIVSQFKNLWIRHGYLQAGRDIDWCFGCAMAAKRSTLMAVGGFDERWLRDTGGSDIELGLRLRDAGVKVVLDPAFEACHHRAFTVPELVRNDLRRASGYTALGMLRVGPVKLASTGRFANISPSYLAGVLLLPPLLLLIIAGLWMPAMAVLGIYAALQAPFHVWMWKEASPAVALSGIGLLALSQLSAGIGVPIGLARAARLRLERVFRRGGLEDEG